MYSVACTPQWPQAMHTARPAKSSIVNLHVCCMDTHIVGPAHDADSRCQHYVLNSGVNPQMYIVTRFKAIARRPLLLIRRSHLGTAFIAPGTD